MILCLSRIGRRLSCFGNKRWTELHERMMWRECHLWICQQCQKRPSTSKLRFSIISQQVRHVHLSSINSNARSLRWPRRSCPCWCVTLRWSRRWTLLCHCLLICKCPHCRAPSASIAELWKSRKLIQPCLRFWVLRPPWEHNVKCLVLKDWHFMDEKVPTE